MAMENATVAGWTLSMRHKTTRQKQTQDRPNYWTTEHSPLDVGANVKLVRLGSGSEVYTSILPALEQAEEEVILVTCFWARSGTLDQVNQSLRRLSKRGLQLGRKIRVRICFSSVSIWQKLLHTRSLAGREYSAFSGQKTLGLPSPDELHGLDLKIKSIFILPFSVMHPKFVILDRKCVFLPSCNVSWESWFEGCVELTGPITDHFVQFWQAYWAPPSDLVFKDAGSKSLIKGTSRAVFLPSPHHALSLLDGISSATSPPTPLNLFILSILNHASRSVYIQTPNLTSRVVLKEIVACIKRGVDVRIITSERLMILEQLVTARTTTARCVKWLKRERRELEVAQRSSTDTEALLPPIGKLEVLYYEPRSDTSDPVQSHIKLMMADDEIIVLGSGNLDRASWVTSQELGVGIIDAAFVHDFRRHLEEELDGRLREV